MHVSRRGTRPAIQPTDLAPWPVPSSPRQWRCLKAAPAARSADEGRTRLRRATFSQRYVPASSCGLIQLLRRCLLATPASSASARCGLMPKPHVHTVNLCRLPCAPDRSAATKTRMTRHPGGLLHPRACHEHRRVSCCRSFLRALRAHRCLPVSSQGRSPSIRPEPQGCMCRVACVIFSPCAARGCAGEFCSPCGLLSSVPP